MLAPAGPQVRTGAKIHAKSDKGDRWSDRGQACGRHRRWQGDREGDRRAPRRGGRDSDAPRARPRAAARSGRRDRRECGGMRRPRPRAGRRGVRGCGRRTRPDQRPRRQQRARRAERRRPRRPLRRPRGDESRRHVLLVPCRSPPPRPRARHPPPRRDRIDPRPDRGARLHRLLRVEGRPARARPLLRRRAGRREHPGERDLPRLGRHRNGVGWAGGDRGRDGRDARGRLPRRDAGGPARPDVRAEGHCRNGRLAPVRRRPRRDRAGDR